MKFSKINIIKSANNYISINWEYEAEYLDNPNIFFIEIGYGSSSSGPFQCIALLPYSTINYNHILEFRGDLTHYFELKIIDSSNANMTDVRVETFNNKIIPIVEKLRKKYNLLLNNKVSNPGLFFKRKKVGYKCKECWDFVTQRVSHDNCSTCYGTSYGNNPVIDKLYLDGILKKGNNNRLEFYRKNFTFNYYPLNGDEALIQAGDNFRVETLDGEILLSTKILSVNTNYFILESSDESIINYLTNCIYSVYREIPTTITNTKIDIKILNKGDEAWIYGLPLKGKKILLNHNIYNISKIKDNKLIITGDLSLLNNLFNSISILDADDSILEIIDISSIVYAEYNEDNYIWFSLLVPPLADDSKFYIDYYYNGKNIFKINTKRTIISESTESHPALGLYDLIGFNNNTYTVKLVTLSNYFKLHDLSKEIYEIVYDQIFNYEIKLTINNIDYCKALEQIEIRLLPYTNIKLPHTNILKTAFEGCGVLLINLQTGLTYKGQKWLGNEYDEEGDIFVDPLNGVINTCDIPEGTYEIKYVYDTKKITFNNTFLPIGATLKDSKLESVDYWVLTHSKLINKNIDLKKHILTIGFGRKYHTFKIDSYVPLSGKIIVKNNLDVPEVFWRSLTADSYFSIDVKNTGGYYNYQPGMINYIALSDRREIPSLEGIDVDNISTILIGNDINIDSGDLIYDETNSIFTNVLAIKPLKFKSQQTAQILQIMNIPDNRVDNLAKLLDR